MRRCWLTFAAAALVTGELVAQDDHNGAAVWRRITDAVGQLANVGQRRMSRHPWCIGGTPVHLDLTRVERPGGSTSQPRSMALFWAS